LQQRLRLLVCVGDGRMHARIHGRAHAREKILKRLKALITSIDGRWPPHDDGDDDKPFSNPK
jgi:hypothetical protein